MTEKIGYGEAMRELEQILEQIEGDDVDVDLLSARVSRSAELIRLCRERIHATRIEVEEIVAGLDAPGSTLAGDAVGDEDDTTDDEEIAQ
jgi:exodeoxyribonuclease VII small subunit